MYSKRYSTVRSISCKIDLLSPDFLHSDPQRTKRSSSGPAQPPPGEASSIACSALPQRGLRSIFPLGRPVGTHCIFHHARQHRQDQHSRCWLSLDTNPACRSACREAAPAPRGLDSDRALRCDGHHNSIPDILGGHCLLCPPLRRPRSNPSPAG